MVFNRLAFIGFFLEEGLVRFRLSVVPPVIFRLQVEGVDSLRCQRMIVYN